VRRAVEAQLGPALSRRERQRRLEKVKRILEYHQTRREQAARYHSKERLKRLRSKGIYVSRLPKCHYVF
jgi:hypothetical protein